MFTTYKRWTLKEGADESKLVDLVVNEIEPHYRKLDADVRLELLRVDGTRSYLAVQHWPSREHYQRVVASPDWQSWYAEYEATLAAWDRLMSFESEWETETLV